MGRRTRVGCRLGLALMCAGPVAQVAAQQQPLMEVRFPAFKEPIRTDTLIYGWERIDASRARTFAALQAVYGTLGFETDFLDSSRTALGALRSRPPRRLAGNRLSTYLTCGRSMIGENADTHRVTVAVVTYLRDVSPTITDIGTGMTGMAQDLTGASNQPAPCSSLNVLEARIAELVREQLTAPAQR